MATDPASRARTFPLHSPPQSIRPLETSAAATADFAIALNFFDLANQYSIAPAIPAQATATGRKGKSFANPGDPTVAAIQSCSGETNQMHTEKQSARAHERPSKVRASLSSCDTIIAISYRPLATVDNIDTPARNSPSRPKASGEYNRVKIGLAAKLMSCASTVPEKMTMILRSIYLIGDVCTNFLPKWTRYPRFRKINTETHLTRAQCKISLFATRDFMYEAYYAQLRN